MRSSKKIKNDKTARLQQQSKENLQQKEPRTYNPAKIAVPERSNFSQQSATKEPRSQQPLENLRTSSRISHTDGSNPVSESAMEVQSYEQVQRRGFDFIEGEAANPMTIPRENIRSAQQPRIRPKSSRDHLTSRQGRRPTTSNTRSDQQSYVTKITREVQRGSDQKVEIDLDALRSVLKNPKYEDYQVAVYSIAGPYRTGKSFLLSLLLQLFKENWETSSSAEVQQSEAHTTVEKWFSWRSGMKRHTDGIYILTEPIVSSKMNPKTALFLMDTQGLFDHETSSQGASIIGTLSFLLSSLQCFNVKERIDSINLEHVYKFAELASEMKQQLSTSLIQKGSLLFIVRDWDEDSYPPGFEGGNKYFSELLEPDQSSANEHSLMRDYLKDTFGDIPCLVLPYPGSAVRKKDVPCYIKDLNPTFQNQVFELYRSMTPSSKLIVKKMNEKVLSCKELCNYIENFAPVLEQEVELDVQSFIQAHLVAQIQNLVLLCCRHLQDKIEENTEKLRKSNESFAQTMRSIMEHEAGEFLQNLPQYGREWFHEIWKIEIENLLFQIDEDVRLCLHAERKFWKNLEEFLTWMQKNVREGVVLREAEKVKVSEKRKKMIMNLKKTVPQKNICDKLCEYFSEYIDKVLTENPDKVVKMFEAKSSNIKVVIQLQASDSNSLDADDQHSHSKPSNSSSSQQRFLHNYKSGSVTAKFSFGNLSVPLKCLNQP